MYPEADPIRRPLPKEVIFSSSQENLASQVLRVLEGVQETGETYNLRGAARFLNQLGEERGIKAKISYETLRAWVVISLAEIVGPIASLPQEQLTPEVFREKFPDEENLPLSPTALSSSGERKQSYKNYSLRIKDLHLIVFYAQEAYQDGLNLNFRIAKGVTKDFREKCLPLGEIAVRLKRKEVSLETRYLWAKELDGLMLEGLLPLKGYPLLFARTFGIPKVFFEQKLKSEWQEHFLQEKQKRKEKLHPLTLLKKYPEKFKTLSSFLRSEDIKFLNKNIRYLATYLKEKGVEIILHQVTRGTYYILAPEQQNKIERLLEDEKTQEEIKQILSKSSAGPRRLYSKGEASALTRILRQEGIKIASHWLPFIWRMHLADIKGIDRIDNKRDHLYLVTNSKREGVVEEIRKRHQEILQTLEKKRAIGALLRQEKTLHLTWLLKSTFPDLTVSTQNLHKIYQGCLADIEEIKVISGRKSSSYHILKSEREAVCQKIKAHEEEIQALLSK